MHSSDGAITQPAWEKATAKKAVVAVLVCCLLALQSAAVPLHPFHRDASLAAIAGLEEKEEQAEPTGLTAGEAVVKGLEHQYESRAAALAALFRQEEHIAARRKLLVQLNQRYSLEQLSNSGKTALSKSQLIDWQAGTGSAPDAEARRREVALLWSVLDAAMLYLDNRPESEDNTLPPSHAQRLRQQITLDTVSAYWRAAALDTIAREAEQLRRDIGHFVDSADQAQVDVQFARRVLDLEDGLDRLKRWSRAAKTARLELADIIGLPDESIPLDTFPEQFPGLPSLPHGDPSALQPAALVRRPEFRTVKGEGMTNEVETRKVLVRFVPKASITLSRSDADLQPEWRNWMTIGAKVCWNIFTSTAYMPESGAPNPYGNAGRLREPAKGAAAFAQVGIAYVEWKLEAENAAVEVRRAETRRRLVDALAAEPNKNAVRLELLEERLLLHSERTDALLALAEARIASARLANAIGFDTDDQGQLLWKLDAHAPVDLLKHQGDIPSALLAGVERSRRALGEMDGIDQSIQAMAPSNALRPGPTRVDMGGALRLDDAALINEWAEKEQLSGKPITSESTPAQSSSRMLTVNREAEPITVAEQPQTALEADLVPTRLMQADDMRKKVTDKREETSRRYPVGQTTMSGVGIPGLSIHDFDQPAPAKKNETLAVETPALHPAPATIQGKSVWPQQPARPVARAKALIEPQEENISITGVKLRPSPGGSLRPPGAGPEPVRVTETLSATAERKAPTQRSWDSVDALEPLQPLPPLQPINPLQPLEPLAVKIPSSSQPAAQPQLQLQSLNWPDEPLDFLPAIQSPRAAQPDYRLKP